MSVVLPEDLKKKLTPPSDSNNGDEGKRIFIEGCCLCLRQTKRYYPDLDVSKATNGITHSTSFKRRLFSMYNTLVEKHYIIEAYCLLRMAFSTLTTQELMDLHLENRLLCQNDAYRCAQHDSERDQDEIPF